MEKLTLKLLPETFGVCRLDKDSPIPDWALSGEMFFLAKTPDELSVVCPQTQIPGGVLVEKDWKAFKVAGPLGFVLTGIVASLADPLAKAGISILYISTYETDYLFLAEKNLEQAKEILQSFCTINE